MTGVDSDGARARARAALWANVAYLVSFVLLIGTRSPGALVALVLLWPACFVSALLALQHGHEHGHNEGRGAALLGLFLTTGCIGPVIVMIVRPAADV